MRARRSLLQSGHGMARRIRGLLLAVSLDVPFLVPALSMLCLAVAGSASAQAAQRALLVGVTAYPTLGPELQLQGPRSDVQRMRHVLLQRGFQPSEVTVVADGVADALEPNRVNILRAMDRQLLGLKQGDFLLVYFAGHGSQQPADRRSPEGREEADGLHEVILPSDVGAWNPKTGTIANAILDHELRRFVDRATGQGVFVWAIFDACHSASLVRGSPGASVRYRHVSPSDLGVGHQALGSARQSQRPGLVEPAGPRTVKARGGSVLFYAAQTTELAPEMRLPRDDPNSQVFGLFTYAIARALESGHAMTYRQLAQYVLMQYGGVLEARATPQFAGDALDRYVLEGRAGTVRQWPVSVGPATMALIPAGSLHGLVPGAVFALMPGPELPLETAVGYLEARKVDLTGAELIAIGRDGRLAPDLTGVRAGMHARLVDLPERFSLRVQIDARGCGRPCRWQPQIDRMKAGGVPGTNVEWVELSADLILKLGPGEIVAIPPSEQGQVQCGAGGRPCDKLTRGVVLIDASSGGSLDAHSAWTRLAEAMHDIARAGNLLRLAAQLAISGRSNGLIVELGVKSADGPARQISAEQVATVRAGDQLLVTLRNVGARPIDVTVLYLDAKWGISNLFPSDAGEVNRLEAGAELALPPLAINDNDGVFGLERLLAIAVTAEKSAERTDLSFLAQRPREAQAATRGGVAADDVAVFAAAALGSKRAEGSRGTIAADGRRAATVVQTFSLEPTGR